MKKIINIVIWSICFLAVSSYAETPIFSDNVLKIPGVLLPSNNQFYQNIEMRSSPDGRWDLLRAEKSSLSSIESIDVLIMESFPVQISVAIKGYLPDSCTTRDKTITEQIDNTFHIILTQSRPQEMECATVIVPFEETVSLDVLGLSAGIYELKVNDKNSSFELEMDNIAGDQSDQDNSQTVQDEVVCCQSYCCTCGPDHWEYSYSYIPAKECRRPENLLGGNCFEIVDNSNCF